MSDDLERTVHVMVEGRVQRVGYRAWTEGQAQARGLGGWVRNRASGAVEAIFAGPAPAVAAMLEACEQGPAAAQVSHVDARDATPEEMAALQPGRFAVRETA
jgi:acylphosphatase